MKQFRLIAALGLVLTLGLGCGMIADKERIKIAKFGDEYITRGDIMEVLRNMPDEERPVIRSRGDIERVLVEYINNRIKSDLADKYQAEGRIKPNRALAEQVYFQRFPDNKPIMEMETGEELGIGPAELAMLKDEVETGIDRVEEELLGDFALRACIQDAVQAGELTITDEEYQREYEVRKDELKQWEWVDFEALKFPVVIRDGEKYAANARRRIDEGEPFEQVMASYRKINPAYAMRAQMENDPGLQNFRSLWASISESKPGDVIGPVYIPAYSGVAVDGVPQTLPPAYMIVKIIDHRPEGAKPLEDAKQELASSILIRKMLAQLREEYGVEIYRDKIANPDLFQSRPMA